MSDPLQIHHDEQKSHEQLRYEFREEARKSLQEKLRRTAIVRDSDGEVIGEFAILDNPLKGDKEAWMKSMYDHPQNFGLDKIPQSIIDKMFSKAEETEVFETMSLPEGEGVDHDAPPLAKPVEQCTEEELNAYVDSVFNKETA